MNLPGFIPCEIQLDKEVVYLCLLKDYGQVDVQVLRDIIFKDERTFNKLRREYGNPVLFGKDVKKLVNGEKRLANGDKSF